MNFSQILVWIVMVWVIIAPAVQLVQDYYQKKELCSNLYSKTVNYEACLAKRVTDSLKLIKPIDTEVEE